MKSPNIPVDESKRLETLHSLRLLDTPSEDRFDRLTRIARRLFSVSAALVSLVDRDRQWFKSRTGLDAIETPRDVSFCGHAILDDRAMVVPNALDDERFFDNPLVSDAPHIRFYAGFPLSAPNGQTIGTLCIFDTEPRRFPEEDVQLLGDLAQLVQNEIATVKLATVDDLTNITNRRGFKMLAQHSLNLCARQAIAASLVFVDLDGFKPINDIYGHAEGDLALTAFAERMKAAYRETDIVARLGGDEPW